MMGGEGEGWRALLPAYYVALWAGVLPASREGPLFHVSLRGALFTALHAAVYVATAVLTAQQVLPRLARRKCTIDNNCLAVAVYASQLVLGAVTLGGALLTPRRALRALNGAAALMRLCAPRADRGLSARAFAPVVPVLLTAARALMLVWLLPHAVPGAPLGALAAASAAVEGLFTALLQALQSCLRVVNAELQGLRLRGEAARELFRLRRLHAEVARVATLVARRFGLDALALVTVAFVQVVMLLFFAVVSLSAGSAAFPAWYFISTGTHIALLVLRICFLCYTCEELVAEGERTGVLLQRLSNWSLSAETKEEIRFFTVQLNTHKLDFTACGFFPINFSLLPSIVGSMATYLVILVQFDPEVAVSEGAEDTHGLRTERPWASHAQPATDAATVGT